MNAYHFSSIKADGKPRYIQKLDLLELKDCPYSLAADVWCDNPVQWPEVEYLDIYDYLINTPGKSETATQFLVSLFDFLDFLFLKRLIEELEIIVAKALIVAFCQIIGF